MEPNVNGFIKNYKPFVTKLESLTEIIRHVAMDENFTRLENLVSDITTNYAKISNYRIEIDIPGYFIFWSQISRLELQIQTVMDLIANTFSQNMTTFVTKSTVGHVLKEEHQLVSLWKKASNQNAIIVDTLRGLISDSIVAVMGDLKISDLQSLFRIDTIVVDLYVELMNKLLLKCTTEGKQDLVGEILQTINSDKSWIIERGIPVEKTSFEIPMTNFGLVPLHHGVELHELKLNELTKKSKTIPLLGKELNKKGIDLILINKIIEYPIEYSISELISKFVNKNTGVSTKVINEFKTISMTDEIHKWNFSIESIKAAKSTKVIVLQCTSDKYSLMSTMLGGSPVLAQIEMQELYDYIAGTPSLKRDAYNSKVMEATKATMFLDTKFRDEDSAFEIDTTNIINTIFLELSREFKRNLPAKFPEDQSKLRELFVGRRFVDLVHGSVTNLFHDFFKKNMYSVNIDKIHLGEAYMTFLFQLAYFERSFYKELGDKFNDFLILLNPKNENLEFFKNQFELTVVNILKKLITKDSNIFLAIYKKLQFTKLSIWN